MPSSAATGGSELLRPPPPYSSASAIVGGTVTGHHILQIDGYSYTKEKLPNGKYILSSSFKVGDHQWQLSYFPNGVNRYGDADFVSVFLYLVEGQPVKARATFSLLDRAGKPVPSYTRDTGMRDFAVTPPDLHRHLGGLLESGDGADVTFRVAGEDVRAHRYILAARSPVFKAELFGQMKESSSSSNTVMNVDDMEAEVFRALLAFIYTDALPETKTKAKQEDELVIAQHLLVVADRYGMERLKLLCEEKVVEFIDRGSVATLMALAEQHHCHGLKGACFRFLESKETLNAVMATDGFLHLMRSCPSLVKDLVFRVADSHFQ
nr:BTB/POZ and MATH domain-containing protein 2-like [Oryza sativa Japonica Group]